MHGSPLKRTHNESVSTDLYALSRGFIPGGIAVPRVWKPALRVEAMVKRRNGSEPVWYGGDSSPASVHGSPLKWTRNESVSTDLYALSRGFIPGGIVVP